MMNYLRMKRWSPYVVGGGIGVLSWVTFGLMDAALGASTTMVRVAGAMEGVVAREHVESNAYFAKYLMSTADKANPVVEWQFALVVMLFFGAMAAAWFARDRRVEHVPALWAWRFGKSKWLRYTAAFTGGVVLLIGARLAGGCTSGHGISGGLQLAISSWTFLIFMFIAGVPMALAQFGWEGRKHV